MSDGMGVKVAGFAELEKELRQLPEKIEKKLLGNALRAGGRVAQRALISAAPVRDSTRLRRLGKKSLKLRAPGFLRRSITVRRAKRGRNRTFRYFIGPKVFYGQYLERGTAKMSPRPWMERAWRPVQRAALKKLTESLRRGIARQVKPTTPTKRRPRG